MFEKSIIVSAHPDDEVLWFSSILANVDEVVICYLEGKSKPAGGNGRKKSLLEHPMKNMSCLEINSAGAFNAADWNNPAITRFGMNLSKQEVLKVYKENYYTLKERLQTKLKDYQNVFTHNPWGEYGHEEHVQIYRAVKELQGKMQYNLWFSNYCSNSSFNLMMRYVSGFDSEYVTLETNKALGNSLMSLYKKNDCWTWYDDWEWFNEESFMKDRDRDEVKTYGHIFPLNMIKITPFDRADNTSEKATSKLNHLLNVIKKMIKQ